MQFIYQILVPNSSYKKSYVLDVCVCVCVLFKKLEFLYGTARVKHFFKFNVFIMTLKDS